MRFFRESQDLFRGVPGPSPWYLRADAPHIAGYEWRQVGDTGHTSLVGPSGPVLIVGWYQYVSVIERSLLLIWGQRYGGPVTYPISVLVFEPALLSPMGFDRSTLRDNAWRDGPRLLYEGTPVASFELATVIVGEPVQFAFPVPVSRLRELLILCCSSSVDRRPTDEMNLALLVAHPADSAYQLYQQDWYNQGGFDYGYEWVTRVVRNPRTGRIHGEGIRIKPFVLDDSLRRLAQAP